MIRTNLNSMFWFVLYTRPNCEKFICVNLREQGFNSYLPLQKEARVWNDRKAIIETPLFRSYVFVRTTMKNKNKVFQVDGIVKFVSFGSNPAIISEQEIERIKQLCLYKGKVNIEYECLESGKKVEICNGILKGMRGVLTEANDNKKIRIHIESLNCFASVLLNLDSIALKYIS